MGHQAGTNLEASFLQVGVPALEVPCMMAEKSEHQSHQAVNLERLT